MRITRNAHFMLLISSMIITLPVLLLLVWESDLISAVSANNGNDIQLTAYLESSEALRRSPSCIHTFASLVMVNTHEKEMITIYSMEAVPRVNMKNMEIYTSHFANRVIEIMPRESITVPIKFFPQIPSYYSDCEYNRSNSNDLGDPWHYCLSMIAAADFADLGGNALGGMASDWEDGEHAVQATLRIRTSRGMLKHTITASALKHNPYRVPHSILFHSDGFVSNSDLNYAGREYAYGHRLDKNITDDKAYEFDLYMDNNNMSEELRVIEVFTSRHDLFEIKYFHLGGYRGNNLAYFRYNNCGPGASDIRHCNQPKAHELDGPISLPADGKRYYIATIKLIKKAMTSMANEDRSFLGYLHIVTSRDELSIVLEYERQKGRKKVPNQYVATERALDDAIAKSSLTGLDIDTIHDSGRYPLKTARHSCDIMNGRKTGSKSRQMPSNSSKIYRGTPSPLAAVSSSTNFVDFGVLTSSDDTKVQDISITNHGDFDLHLMRAKIITDFGPEFSNQKQNSRKVDEFRLAVKAVIAIAEDDDSRIIAPGATVDGIVSLSISPNADIPISESDLPLVYHGSAIIHAGRVDQSYYDWKHMVINDPAAASTYIVEIAFTVRIIYGHIEYDIENAYFPAKQSAMLDEKATTVKGSKHSCTKSFDRTLHVTNIFPIPLRIKRIQIQGFTENTSTDPSLLSHEFCSDRFKIVQFGGGGSSLDRRKNVIAKSGQSWGGITLRYTYSTNGDQDILKDSKRCILLLETDLAGEFDVPLWIFSGLVHVRPEQGVIPPHCRSTSGSGLGCLESTFNKMGDTNVFSSPNNLNNKQNEHAENRSSSQKGWMHTASKELLSMGRGHENTDSLATNLEPIVLSVGSLESKSINTCSIFITNHNPTTISMTALISSVEGTEIRLGRSIASLMDYLKGAKADASIDKDSSPLDQRASDWLRTYLSTTNLSQNVFGPLRFRDDIRLSRTAPNEIKQLFHKNAIIRLYQNSSDSDESIMKRQVNAIDSDKKMLQMHPPGFTNATISSIHTGSIQRGSSIFSVPTVSTQDGTFTSELMRGHTQSDDPVSWFIPPGGVARLELSVRPPPESALLGREYVDFISSGVVLQTNYGQRLPIIVKYRALAGHLHMSADDALSETLRPEGTTIWLNTPAILRPKTALKKKPMANDKYDLPENEQGTEVLIKNTFPKGAILKKVYSCNSWFSIFWNDSSVEDGLEPISASVHSLISCPNSSKNKSAATFFDCALVWLEQRHQIQQGRCEMKDEEFTNINSKVTEHHLFSESEIESLRSKLILHLKDMISYLDNRYQEGGKKLPFEGNRSIPILPGQEINDDFLNKLVNQQMGSLKDHVSTQTLGIISLNLLDMFDEIVAGWHAISALGLNIVTGNVRADIEIKSKADSDTNFRSTTTSEPQNISIPLASPSLQSILEIPRIFNPRDNFAGSIIKGENHLHFNLTHVAQVAKLFVPLHNPTGSPIRVRLATIQSRKRKSTSVKSGTLYSSVDSDFFVQTSPRELNPWWTGGSYYLADKKGTMMGSTHNVTLKAGKGASLKLSNPSLHSSVAFVQGCFGRRCGYPVPKDPKKPIPPQAYISSIGASAATGEILRGHYYDREGGENELSSSAESNIKESQPFALGLKSLEEIIIPPFGIGQVGPVYFRPTSRRKFTGLLFLENNLTGLENIIVKGKGGWEKVVIFDSLSIGMNGDDLESRYGKPTLMFSDSGKNGSIVKSVVVANVGDTEVQFQNVHLSEASLFQSNKHQSNVVHQHFHQSKKSLVTNRCSKRGFTLLGCYDDIKETKEDDANGLIHKIIAYISRFFSHTGLSKVTNNESFTSNILDGFTLSPHESKVLHISHTPDSTFRSMYIALNLEVKRVDDHSQHLGPKYLQFQDKTLQLLLGHDQRHSERRASVQSKKSLNENSLNANDTNQASSIHVENETRKHVFHRIFELLIAAIPLLMLFLILLDIFSGSRQRYAASKSFEAFLSPYRGLAKSKEFINMRKNDNDNWICAYRCLSRVDPNFSDLQHFGREQTRQILLGRYRKNVVLHPQCILPSGTFVRERHSSITHSDSNEVKGGSAMKDEISTSPMLLRRNAGPMAVIFYRYRDLNSTFSRSDLHLEEEIPAAPCDLHWREAARRGVISSPTGNSGFLETKSMSTGSCQTSSAPKFSSSEVSSQSLDGVSAVKNVSLHEAHKTSSRLHNENHHKKSNGSSTKPTKSEISPDRIPSKPKSNKTILHTKPIQAADKPKTTLRQIGKPKINTRIPKQTKTTSINDYSNNTSRMKIDSSGIGKKHVLLKGTIERQTMTLSPLSTKSPIQEKAEDYASKLSFSSIVVPPKVSKIDTSNKPKDNQFIQPLDTQMKGTILATRSPTAANGLLETLISEVDSVESDEVLVNNVGSSSPKAQPKLSPANSLSPLSFQDGSLPKEKEINEDSSWPCISSETIKYLSPSPSSPEPDLSSQQSSADGRSTLKAIVEESTSHELPIRPPPGLSPPPGFSPPISAAPHLHTGSTDFLEKSPEIVSLGMAPDIQDSALFEGVLINSSSKLEEELKNKTENIPSLPLETDPYLMRNGNEMDSNPQDEPLLGLGNDFNVMNFLNFLEDNVVDDESSEQVMIDNQVKISSIATNNTLSMLNYNTNASSGIRSNPWGVESETSRALAYGIEVETEGENHLDDHLASARFFGMDGVTVDDDTSDMKEDSFFSNLLKGD